MPQEVNNTKAHVCLAAANSSYNVSDATLRIMKVLWLA